MIADVHLPDGESTDLLRELQSRPQKPLVVMISGFGTVESAVECMRCGAFDYLIKPFSAEQIEGAVTMAIGGALFEAIQFDNGKILNPKFSSYRVPRFSDMPAIEIVLVDRKDVPSAGAGETPIVGLAPAIGNAIFSAAGTRLRSLPLVPKGVTLNAKG
jgi:isoquinoline 1-oxidoreductase